MTGERRRRLRYSAFLLALCAFFSLRAQPVATFEDWCDEACDPYADCNTECLVASDPAFMTTCGEYDGGAANGWCWEGYCGDDVCDLSRGEHCGTCSDDCGPCPDPPVCGSNGCEIGENCQNCPSDCGYCPMPGIPDDDKCSDDEYPEEPDCEQLGYCDDNSDCDNLWHGGQYGYSCVAHMCMANELPDWAISCDDLGDCDWGERCADGTTLGFNGQICLPWIYW